MPGLKPTETRRASASSLEIYISEMPPRLLRKTSLGLKNWSEAKLASKKIYSLHLNRRLVKSLHQASVKILSSPSDPKHGLARMDSPSARADISRSPKG